MANSERDYGSTIDLQGFDVRTDMDTIEEPSRLPLLVAIALVVLAAFAGVVWLAYTQGVERGRASVSRELVARELWTIRKSNVPPYTGLKIYEQPSAAAGQTTATTVAPKRVATNPIPALRPTASAVSDNSPPSTATARPAAGGVSPVIHPGAAAVAEKALPTPQPQRVATRAPTELVKPAAAPPTHPITSLESPPQQQMPAKPASTPAPPPASTSAPATSPASASVPATTPARAAIGGVVLQIGSYKSEAEARQSWNAFKSEHDAAAGYQSDVKAADLGARGTWYRLRMGPFADRKAAQQVCARLKADGASCLLAQ